MSQDLLPKVDRGDFQEVFIEDLNWLAPDVKQSISVTDDDGRQVSAHNVASYKGLRVWVCDERPGSVLEAELDRLIAKTTTDRLVIFDDEKEQVWRWPVRRAKDGSVTSRLTSHRHKKGATDPKFAARLDIIRMPFDVILDANAVLGRVREAFDTEAQNESKRASKLMANMYAAVEKAYPTTVAPKVRDHEISVTLARILFLMFGDDTEMWHTDAFRNVIQHETLPDGSNLAQVLNDLFTFLDTANPSSVPNGFEGFKYVNGGIFEEKIELPQLGKDFRAAILDACAVDWSSISPAIFGSMFQSVRDAATRRALGEHYTSEENILKTLNPLFLDELREELAAALARDTTQKKVNALNKLWDRLGAIRFMDPACGCGNFIIVAYRELRAIELQVMEALYDLRDKHQLSLDAKSDLKVTLDHFYGIEIDEWPARIAETAMFMMDRQCDLKLRERFGQAPERLPIHREARIVVGNALTLDWKSVMPLSGEVMVAGNPPFLGHATRSDAQALELRNVWGRDDISRLDYVTGWHAMSLRYLAHRPDSRFAFVSTNSITQGDPVPHLFAPVFDGGWRIRFAHRTFPWQSDATGKAAVHCVIVGFDRVATRGATLYESGALAELGPRVVDEINGYLVAGPRVFVAKRSAPLAPGLPEATFGNMPRDDGNLIVTQDEYAEAAADPFARKYLRPFLGAEELLHGKQRWCLWLVDADPLDLERSPLLRHRIAAVQRFRLASSASSTRKMASTPHLFGQRPAQHQQPYLVIPGVSSELRDYYPVRRVDPAVIASNATFTASDPSGLLFSVISSSMFMAWQSAVGGRLKSDLRFSNTIVWNNFPLPSLSDRQRSAVIAAGQAVESTRAAHPQRTLASLYQRGSMPPDLLAAHRELDRAVDEAFGLAEVDATEVGRQGAIFKRYVDAASGQHGPTPPDGRSRGRRK
mgnify:FL=1